MADDGGPPTTTGDGAKRDGCSVDGAKRDGCSVDDTAGMAAKLLVTKSVGSRAFADTPPTCTGAFAYTPPPRTGALILPLD